MAFVFPAPMDKPAGTLLRGRKSLFPSFPPFLLPSTCIIPYIPPSNTPWCTGITGICRPWRYASEQGGVPVFRVTGSMNPHNFLLVWQPQQRPGPLTKEERCSPGGNSMQLLAEMETAQYMLGNSKHVGEAVPWAASCRVVWDEAGGGPRAVSCRLFQAGPRKDICPVGRADLLQCLEQGVSRWPFYFRKLSLYSSVGDGLRLVVSAEAYHTPDRHLPGATWETQVTRTHGERERVNLRAELRLMGESAN